MSNLTYEESKKRVIFGLYLLGAVTISEVVISLIGKGDIIPALKGLSWFWLFHAFTALLLLGFSLYKAYFIVYEFMHMRYEVKSLALTVLLPMALLIWAIIAFFQEGNSWRVRREIIKEKDELPSTTPAPQGMNIPNDTYILENWT